MQRRLLSVSLAYLLLLNSIPAAARSTHPPVQSQPRPSHFAYANEGAPGRAPAVEILRGIAARQHLALLRGRKAAPFEMAVRRLSARGFRPTEQVVVMRTAQSSASARSDRFVLPAQSIGTSEGEIVFWAWDDGDDSTWEGTMWVERYGDGAEILQETQFDISTASAQVLWETTIWKKLPDLEYTGMRLNEDVDRSRPHAVLASMDKTWPDPWIETATSGMPRPAREWLACVIGGCLIAAAGCAFSGPLWLECIVVVCAAVKLACTIQIILHYL